MKQYIILAAVLALFPVSPIVAQVTTTTPIAVTSTAPVFPTSLPMIQSPATLREYALSRIKRGSISAYSTSILPDSGNVNYVNVTGNDATEIVSLLTSTTLSFKVANDADSVSVYASLDADDWSSVGGGGGQVQLVKTAPNTWAIAPSNFELDIYSWVSIPTLDATNATVIIRNPDGSVEFIDSMNIYGGRTYYPMKYAGKKGEIILTSYGPDGQVHSQAYKLTGQAITASMIAGRVSVAIANYKKITDAGLSASSSLTAEIYPILPVGQTSEQGPVISVQLATSRTVLVYSAIYAPSATTPWQLPKRVWYRLQGETAPTHSFTLTPGVYLQIVLPAGIHSIGFDFDAFEPMPDPPYYGGKA